MGSVLAVESPAALKRAINTFRRGGVILYPTATLYGLGGDPEDPKLSLRIHSIKGSPETKPHLLLTDEWSRLKNWVRPPTDLYQRLMRLGDDLPITILFEAGVDAPSHLIGRSEHIAVRKTTQIFCRSLILETDSMVISTSANRTGAPPPARFEDVDPEIIEMADIAIRGPDASGLPSTIVSVENDQPVVIREGAVSREMLASKLKSL